MKLAIYKNNEKRIIDIDNELLDYLPYLSIEDIERLMNNKKSNLYKKVKEDNNIVIKKKSKITFLQKIKNLIVTIIKYFRKWF